MIEVLGPSMARAIVGDAYSTDFRYELETDDAGMRLIVTHVTDGTSTCRELIEDSLMEEEKFTPLYHDKTELSKRKLLMSDVFAGICLFAVAACVVLALSL